MATALDVITRALRLCGALQAGESPAADEAQDALVTLQAMLGEWETRGVRLGSVVDMTLATATTIPVPVTHVQALATGLAMALAPEYGVTPQSLQLLTAQAERSFLALQAQYAEVPIAEADPAFVIQYALLNNGGAVSGTDDDALFSDTGPLYP